MWQKQHKAIISDCIHTIPIVDIVCVFSFACPALKQPK